MPGKVEVLSLKEHKRAEQDLNRMGILTKGEALKKALKVLDMVGHLSQHDRSLVLEYALKINDL